MTRILKSVPLILAGIILLVLVLNVTAFQKPAYWRNLSETYFAAAVLALALTPIVLTGGIDLSVGSVTIFAHVIVGALWQDLHWPIGWAIAGGIVAGLLAGSFNGTLVAAGVMPLVATLATRELFRGLARRISGLNGATNLPVFLHEFWTDTLLGVPVPLLGLILTAVFAWFMVHHTWVGRMLYAMGDNETAARFAGVPTRRLKLVLYAFAGLAGGLCGVAAVCEYGSAKADTLTSLELTAIAMVILGGIRVTGGHGHIAGTLLGILTIAALHSGLNSVAPNWRDTITGTLVITVAITNEASQRLATRRLLRRVTG